MKNFVCIFPKLMQVSTYRNNKRNTFELEPMVKLAAFTARDY